MRYIKKFDELYLTQISMNDTEKVDEGLKEILIAGALSLLSHTTKSQNFKSSDVNKYNKEYALNKDTSNQNVITVNFGNEFKSGEHKFDKNKSDSIESKLKEIAEFVKSQSKNNITIHIDAGESQVPNKDAETGERLPKGGLANMRTQNTKDLIDSFMKSLSERGDFKGGYKIDTTTSIGKTPWKIGEDPKQEKFTREQYVKVVLTVEKGSNTVNVVNTPFSLYAENGEEIYLKDGSFRDSTDAKDVKNYQPGYLIANIFYPTRKTNDISKSGNLEGGYQNILLKTVKPNVSTSGKKSETGIYTGSYIVPWEWWNSNVGPSKYLTPNLIKYIMDHFKVKE